METIDKYIHSFQKDMDAHLVIIPPVQGCALFQVKPNEALFSGRAICFYCP